MIIIIASPTREGVLWMQMKIITLFKLQTSFLKNIP